MKMGPECKAVGGPDGVTHAANCPYDGKSWACTCGADRLQNAEADLKAEWANLNAVTEALRNLVFAVDYVDWDCTASAAFGRLDDARAHARAVLAPKSPASGERGGNRIMKDIREELGKPESIDRLALELAHIGIKVPPRDTAFFQVAVSKWLATAPTGGVK